MVLCEVGSLVVGDYDRVIPSLDYLFVLILEIFNCLMRKANEDSEFKFHPSCQELGITHSSFADDMVLLASADMGSFKVLKQTLSLFGDLTGLRLIVRRVRYFLGARPMVL
ncbi:hypothetical protein LIER_23233 [Lithospermum erythrorhizon]|uniref:Reverse transcriptase n=1 Tax=Lithospermum erythrorhizon TaxID=34254 RepID=A0AAV3QWW9_LITER